MYENGESSESVYFRAISEFGRSISYRAFVKYVFGVSKADARGFEQNLREQAIEKYLLPKYTELKELGATPTDVYLKLLQDPILQPVERLRILMIVFGMTLTDAKKAIARIET